MTKYTVSGMMCISVFTEVEAESEKEALEIAEGRSVQGLCHQCATSRNKDEEWSLTGELDGEVTNLLIDP